MTGIQPQEVQFFLSNPSGANNPGLPGYSLGGWKTGTQINQGVPLDNLFLDISGPQNAALQVDYQCLFIANMTQSGNTMKNPVVWLPLSFATPQISTLAVGQDPTGVQSINAVSPQAVSIATNLTPPAGVNTWFGPTSLFYIGSMSIPNIPPFFCIGIWLQRTATNSQAYNNDIFALQVTFNTNA